jgi:hypothetical protein
MSSLHSTTFSPIHTTYQEEKEKTKNCDVQLTDEDLVRTSRYCGFVFYSTLGHVGGGNSCGEHTLMRVTMTQAG